MNLEGKIVIVTGGSGLIGRYIMADLKRRGAIAINAEVSVRTNLELGEICCDITSVESIDLMIDIVLNKYGKIDGLVNNAYPRTKDWGVRFEEIPLESWRKNVDMQLNSVEVDEAGNKVGLWSLLFVHFMKGMVELHLPHIVRLKVVSLILLVI